MSCLSNRFRPLFVGASVALALPAAATGTTLLSFEKAPVASLEKLSGWNASVGRVASYASDGSYAVSVDVPANTTGYANYERVSPLDLSDKGTLLADVYNAGKQSASVQMIVEDASGKSVRIDVVVPPQGWAHPCMMLSDRRKPASFAIRDFPRVAPEARMIAADSWADGNPDLKTVRFIRMVVRGASSAQRIYFDNVRTTPFLKLDTLLKGWIDKYGQNARYDWEGKIKTDADLRAAKTDEDAQLAAWKRPSGYDAYGGDLRGPTLKVTGFFRAQRNKANDWTLITPTGKRFWSFGVNAPGINEPGSVVNGREAQFQWLPTLVDTAARAYTPTTEGGLPKLRFSFQKPNLDRKYGLGKDDAYRQRIQERLMKWGFNTIGAFADQEIVANHAMPITPHVSTNGTIRISVPVSGIATTVPDPYDPLYTKKLAANTWVMKPNDPSIVGYFVDNILPFSAPYSRNHKVELALGVLELNSLASPAKAALMNQLRHDYAKIGILNAAWKTSFASWDALAKGYTLSDRWNGNLVSDPMFEDLREFTKAFARRYFKLTRDTVKAADPNHLYLGCRIDQPDEEIVRIQAEYADVASVLIYQEQVAGGDWSFIKNLDKPLLIGEFGFSSYDRGTPGVFCDTDSAASRAAAYKSYITQCLKLKNIVGAHMYDYVDQNPHGNGWNMENCNHGLVDITDTPYPEMVAASREFGQSLYVVP